jgi:hypothetical protein
MRVTPGDRAANLLFAICCVALVGLGAARHATTGTETYAAREHVLAEGTADLFGRTLDAGSGPGLYVFVSPGCPVCRASLPFYRRLVEETRPPSRVVFVGLEAEAALAGFLREGGLNGARVASIQRPPGVPGTPTIIALDRAGRVTQSWAGRLNRRQEESVIAFAAGSGVSQSARLTTIDELLASVRVHLSAARPIDAVADLEVAGTETRLHDSTPRAEAYGFALRVSGSLELRTGPLVHALSGGVYSRRIADERYGGPMLDRLIADQRSTDVAARAMASHLLRLSVTYLVRAPAGVTTVDEGMRDFGRIKGRTVAFRDAAATLQVELVVDPSTSRPLAVVTPVRNVGGHGPDNDLWISIPEDYREADGVRIPHRIEEWIGANHSSVALTSVKIHLTPR